jgi:hypothetical protein
MRGRRYKGDMDDFEDFSDAIQDGFILVCLVNRKVNKDCTLQTLTAPTPPRRKGSGEPVLELQ